MAKIHTTMYIYISITRIQQMSLKRSVFSLCPKLILLLVQIGIDLGMILIKGMKDVLVFAYNNSILNPFWSVWHICQKYWPSCSGKILVINLIFGLSVFGYPFSFCFAVYFYSYFLSRSVSPTVNAPDLLGIWISYR